MKRMLFFLLFLLPLISFSQGEEKWNWWNDLHGWKPGMPSWRYFMHITPGYLGPNALPVPEVKKGLVEPGMNLEIGAEYQFHPGDPTQDIFGKFYRSFANNKIAIEMYGVLLEHYAMSTYIRDERVARDFDGKGFAVGDFNFSTLIQVSKNRKFPDSMIRFTARTASGNQLEAARYSDCPGYFFDFSASKEYLSKNEKMSFLPFASFGFYSWQTNDDMDFQNDAYMYAAGADLKWEKWTLSNSLSGYSGYKHQRDKPMVYTVDLKHKLKRNTLRLQFLYGIRDWTYKTIRFSYILNLGKQK